MADLEVTPALSEFFNRWTRENAMTDARISALGGPSTPTLRKLREGADTISRSSAAKLEAAIGLERGNLVEISRGQPPRYRSPESPNSPTVRLAGVGATTEAAFGSGKTQGLIQTLTAAAELFRGAEEHYTDGDTAGTAQRETAALALLGDVIRRIGGDCGAYRDRVDRSIFRIIESLREDESQRVEQLGDVGTTQFVPGFRMDTPIVEGSAEAQDDE